MGYSYRFSTSSAEKITIFFKRDYSLLYQGARKDIVWQNIILRFLLLVLFHRVSAKIRYTACWRTDYSYYFIWGKFFHVQKEYCKLLPKLEQLASMSLWESLFRPLWTRIRKTSETKPVYRRTEGKNYTDYHLAVIQSHYIFRLKNLKQWLT